MFITTRDLQDLHGMNISGLWRSFDTSHRNHLPFSKGMRIESTILIKEILARTPISEVPTLTPRERQVVQLFYFESKNLSEIADVLLLTVENNLISKIKVGALRKIRYYTLLKEALKIQDSDGLTDIDVEKAWRLFDEMATKNPDRRSVVALVFRGRLEQTLKSKVTETQHIVLLEYIAGMSIAEIADKHYYCRNTIKYHLGNGIKVLRKLSLQGIKDILPGSMDELWIRYFATDDTVRRHALVAALIAAAKPVSELRNRDANIAKFTLGYAGTTFTITIGG